MVLTHQTNKTLESKRIVVIQINTNTSVMELGRCRFAVKTDWNRTALSQLVSNTRPHNCTERWILHVSEVSNEL